MIHPFTTVKRWHRKFNFHKEPMDLEKLKFRAYLQNEEHDEFQQAIFDRDSEEIVDALIDTIWIACGTLDLLGVDFDKAFSEVARANFDKERGIKPGREQSGGFDVIKGPRWTPPSHEGNHGILDEL
jgi:predicted HAD superfamily Cof-like phosphohydrolase